MGKSVTEATFKTPQDNDFLKLKDVQAEIPLSVSTLYAQMVAGLFPRPIKIGKRSVCWLRRDITEYKARLIAAHDAPTSTTGGK